MFLDVVAVETIGFADGTIVGWEDVGKKVRRRNVSLSLNIIMMNLDTEW